MTKQTQKETNKSVLILWSPGQPRVNTQTDHLFNIILPPNPDSQEMSYCLVGIDIKGS